MALLARLIMKCNNMSIKREQMVSRSAHVDAPLNMDITYCFNHSVSGVCS